MFCFVVQQPGVDGKEEAAGLPSAATLDVTKQYSAWQCTQMVFSHLPLLKIIFNLLTHSCKKASLTHTHTHRAQVSRWQCDLVYTMC